MKNPPYATNLTDDQWELIEPLLPQKKPRGRPRTDLRLVLNAILYLAKAGCAWKLLPSDFPPYKTVFHIFRQWGKDNVWPGLNDRLRALARADEDKRCRPTAAILDSQTVRSAGHGGEVGYDAGKKTKGRKRFLLVDTLGLILGVTVCPANVPERSGAQELLGTTLPHFAWLRKLWVDSGYSGTKFADWVEEQRPKLEVEVVKRSDDVRGFKVVPRRWVVERTLGWLMLHRRLVRDYEKTALSATSWILIAMIGIMTRRIA